jgi:hypothetical protein
VVDFAFAATLEVDVLSRIAGPIPGSRREAIITGAAKLGQTTADLDDEVH